MQEREMVNHHFAASVCLISHFELPGCDCGVLKLFSARPSLIKSNFFIYPSQREQSWPMAK